MRSTVAFWIPACARRRQLSTCDGKWVANPMGGTANLLAVPVRQEDQDKEQDMLWAACRSDPGNELPGPPAA
jgi:hypothetical protein